MILFGLVFAGFGLVFMFVLGKQAVNEAQVYQWEKVPCEIERCEIKTSRSRDENPFQLEIRYRYSFNGHTHKSTRYTLQEHWVADYEKLALKRKTLLNQSEEVCYVNPRDPAQAVMRREGLGTGLMILFPLVFVVIGGAIAWGGVYSLRKKKNLQDGGTESISQKGSSSKKAGWKFMLIFGGIFTLVGGGVAIPLGFMPVQKMMASQGWEETPCKIIWSRVQRHESTSDGKTSITYSVDIFYEYSFAGQSQRSNSYDVFAGSSSGRSGKVEVTKQYPQGSQQICYVDPKLPERALLVRGFSWQVLFGLIPLAFLFAGLLIMRAGIRAKQKTGVKKNEGGRFADAYASSSGGDRERSGRSEQKGAIFGAKSALDSVSGESRELKPGKKRLGGAVVLLVFVLFWNGIVSVFFFEVLEGWQRGKPEWFLTLFLIPFVLVGLVMVLVFFYQLLALSNPKPEITLSPGILRPGQSFELSWKVASKADRIKNMTIVLWGIESATYQRGTSTHTSHEVFFARTLADASYHSDIRSGQVQIELPYELVPSLETGSNAIKWEIRVNADIPRWPDVQDTYKVEVRR